MEKAGVPIVPGYHGERQDRQIPQGEGLRDRLSGADQAGRGRRRPRHAPRRQARRFRRCARRRAPRSRAAFGSGRVLIEKYHRRAAPHRISDLCRQPRQRHPSRRARLLAAAPSPEGDRGSAGARHDRGAARADGRRRGGGGARPSAMSAPAPSNSSPTAAGAAPGRLLVHRNEYPAAGRASGDRGGYRPRSGRLAICSVAAGEKLPLTQSASPYRRPRHRSARLCRGSRARLLAVDRARSWRWSCRTISASTAGSKPAAK